MNQDSNAGSGGSRTGDQVDDQQQQQLQLMQQQQQELLQQLWFLQQQQLLVQPSPQPSVIGATDTSTLHIGLSPSSLSANMNQNPHAASSALNTNIMQAMGPYIPQPGLLQAPQLSIQAQAQQMNLGLVPMQSPPMGHLPAAVHTQLEPQFMLPFATTQPWLPSDPVYNSLPNINLLQTKQPGYSSMQQLLPQTTFPSTSIDHNRRTSSSNTIAPLLSWMPSQSDNESPSQESVGTFASSSDLTSSGTRTHRRRQRKRNCKSRFRGVTWHARDTRWIARNCVDGKVLHLGNYKSEERAALAVDDNLLELYSNPEDTQELMSLLNFKRSQDRERIRNTPEPAVVQLFERQLEHRKTSTTNLEKSKREQRKDHEGNDANKGGSTAKQGIAEREKKLESDAREELDYKKTVNKRKTAKQNTTK